MFLEAGGGAARRAQPAAAGFACGFALRAKSGAAVVGKWQRAAAGRPAGRIAAGRSSPPTKNKTRKTAVLRAWFGAYR